MAYTSKNYKTKKSLKEAIKNGVKVTVFQPASEITGATIPDNGVVYLEGPHYPQPHKWYAIGEMKDGFLVKIK